jgi:hypothetical protein
MKGQMQGRVGPSLIVVAKTPDQFHAYLVAAVG